jgi:hypothetical protein
MGFDLAAYERIVARVDVDDVDFAAFADEPLRPEHLRCVRYMHDVEHHTSCYLRNLLNTKAHHDPEITTFLTLWNFEEHWHGEALGRVLEAHGEPAGASRVSAMRQRLGWRVTASPLAWMALSAATPDFLAVHMAFGVINEWTTQAGYARLGAEARHPVLSELLRRIMRQEGRHIDFYRHQAVERLSVSRRAQRWTRALIRGLWHPVGAKAMPHAETRHLVRTLFGGAAGADVAARIDRRVDALPGLAGLRLMAGARARYAGVKIGG